MGKKAPARKRGQIKKRENAESTGVVTKGLAAIAYTAGAVAELASKSFAQRGPAAAEKSKILPKLQKEKSTHTLGKSARGRSRANNTSAESRGRQR